MTPWPSALASTSCDADAAVSRAQVTSIVEDALPRRAFTEALVATYVWGKGKEAPPAAADRPRCEGSWPPTAWKRHWPVRSPQ
ncbi:8-oxoguanine DNA glycosylase OGG fold protein [Streptomyces sp. NPDC003480]